MKKEGFYCGNDVAREFIEEQIRSGGKALPWDNRKEFSKIILEKRIKQYEDAPEGDVCFFDRGIPDLIGYLIKAGLKVPDEYYKSAKSHPYQKIVFFTPPWQATFEKDPDRHETFGEAVIIHNAIKKVYQDLGYKVIDVPKTSVDKRIEFILKFNLRF